MNESFKNVVLLSDFLALRKEKNKNKKVFKVSLAIKIMWHFKYLSKAGCICKQIV